MSSTNERTSCQQSLTAAGLPTSMAGVAPATITASKGAPRFRSALVMGPAPVAPAPSTGSSSSVNGKASISSDAFTNSSARISVKGVYSKKSPHEAGMHIYERGVSKEDRNHPFESIPKSNWLVDDGELRSVPAYYPLEKTSRSIVGATAGEIAARISECCRIMSVQADYDHEAATAILRTKEHMEMRLSLWRGAVPGQPPNCVIVEAQRWRGDAVIYHKYWQNILNATQGVFHVEDFVAQEERDRSYAKMAEQLLAEKYPSQYRVEQRRNSMLAIEIVSSLLNKDQMDAQQLGMESLCQLTDPARTIIETALMASHVILTGSARDEPADEDCFSSEELAAESELGIREAILSLVQYGKLDKCRRRNTYKGKVTGGESIDQHPEEREHNNILHTLGLAVLANSLETLESHSEKLAAGSRQDQASVTNRFLLSTKEILGLDLLSLLLDGVRNVGRKPLDACFSVRCLRSLCEVSPDARQRACNSDAKTIVSAALDIGRRTNKNLETATERLLVTLEKPIDN